MSFDNSKFPNYYEARYGEFAEYMRDYTGPVIVTDISVDMEPHTPYIASFDYYPGQYDYSPNYNVSLTCKNPNVLKRILELIKYTDFSEEDKTCLNAKIRYVGKVDTRDNLPEDAKIGELYCADNSLFVYGGNGWDFVYTLSQENDELEIKCETPLRYKLKHKVLSVC